MTPAGGAPGTPGALVTLLSAPHRLLFAAAALLWCLVAGQWAMVPLARAAGLPMPNALPPAAAHALPMTLGFLPLFFAGFLFTALPRWLQVPAPDVRRLRAPAAAALLGWLLVLPALHLGRGGVAAALLPAAVGHGQLVLHLLHLCRQGAPGTRRHALLASAGCALCAAALWAAIAALACNQPAALAAVLAVALWAGLGSVFVTAAHRLSPWFAPRGLVPLLLGLLAQGGGAAAQALGWAPNRPLAALLALGLAALGARLAWGLRRGALPHGQRTRTLRLLRAPAGWLAAALLLSAAAHGARLAGPGALAGSGPADVAVAWAGALAMAATHALALGFFGGMVLAMASRVAAVHSGHAVGQDGTLWALHGLLQALVLGRLAAALLAPAAAGHGGLPASILAAALAGLAILWAGIAAAWAAHAGRWLLQRPPDAPPRGRSVPITTPPLPRPQAGA